MLVALINERHRGSFDYLYLPIDFLNHCNVGYAFINMMSTSGVLALYNDLHRSAWKHFNSSKICEITYARL
jgi:hypothetical protein